MAGKLTTHVLDTALGRPAAELKIDLFEIIDDRRIFIKTVITNNDGRCDAPLLKGDAFKEGTFELLFYAGDYLQRIGDTQSEPLFLNIIPIRFGINEHDSHYHVPLLLSPFGYSTYRGS